jgi:hypothetical protein
VTDLPPNLPERLWAALWPEYPLLHGNGCYATVHDNGLLIAENIGTLAQMISELAEPLPGYVVWSGVSIALPRRR